MNEIPRDAKNGSKYNPAMQIHDQTEADIYFKKCVRHCMLFKNDDGSERTMEQAEYIERSNIGYWAGYYDAETAERVCKLFKAKHPVFGDTTPRPADAHAVGIEQGQSMGASIEQRRIGKGTLDNSPEARQEAEGAIQKAAEELERHPMREEWLLHGKQAAKLCIIHCHKEYNALCKSCAAAVVEIGKAFHRGREEGICEAEDYRGWLPTSKNINKLPEPLRKYIHDIETNCDPAGMVQENAVLRDRNKELQCLVGGYKKSREEVKQQGRREENEAWQKIVRYGMHHEETSGREQCLAILKHGRARLVPKSWGAWCAYCSKEITLEHAEKFGTVPCRECRKAFCSKTCHEAHAKEEHKR